MREAHEHAPGEISAGGSDHSGGGELGRGDNSAMAGDEGVDMWHNCVRGSGARDWGGSAVEKLLISRGTALRCVSK